MREMAENQASGMEGKIKALKEDDMAEKISVDTLKDWLDDPQRLATPWLTNFT